MIFESVQFSKDQVWLITLYVGATLCASYMFIVFVLRICFTAAKVRKKKDMHKGEGDFSVGEAMPEWYSNDLLRCTDGIDEVKSGSQPLQ